ncbi:hypothetical protein [Arthrobacter sp. StoSoilB5]|nr:hypothetical protein [Arthrobacter sp. StoSoilB5]
MIGILLVLIAVVLALEPKSVLLGEPASKDDRDKITTPSRMAARASST